MGNGGAGKLQPERFDIEGYVDIGASGAIAAAGLLAGRGVVSITKESTAGRYTFVLKDTYSHFYGADINHLHTAAVAGEPQVRSQDVATEANRTVVIDHYDTSDTAVDVPSGTRLFFHFKLGMSRQPVV